MNPMSALLKFLFPTGPYTITASWFLLVMRLLFGGLLFMHGVAKWSAFDQMRTVFPDPMGMGTTFSLVLAIFTEVFCSVGFILGAFYRLALIPMIVTMWVALCVVHAGDPFSQRELPFIYLAVFILLYATGPGSYALDRLVARRLR